MFGTDHVYEMCLARYCVVGFSLLVSFRGHAIIGILWPGAKTLGLDVAAATGQAARGQVAYYQTSDQGTHEDNMQVFQQTRYKAFLDQDGYPVAFRCSSVTYCTTAEFRCSSVINCITAEFLFVVHGITAEFRCSRGQV